MASENFTYKNNAKLYNQVEDIPGEKAMLIESTKIIENFIKDKNRKIKILDVCCGTELIFTHFSRTIKDNIEKFVGIDISAEYLENARQTIGNDPRFTFIQHDAVTYKDNDYFDIIIAGSAYHHIEDERKLIFLSNLREHLIVDGIIIFMENILPYYYDDPSRAVSAIEFYSQRIVDCIDNYQIRDDRIRLLSRVMQYEVDHEYEMKSHYWLFCQHLQQTGLTITYQKKVWPIQDTFRDSNAGDFVFIIKK